jgi:5-(carboxyamino)imidazole ribonucleotide synthase
MTKIWILWDWQLWQLTALEAQNMSIETIIYWNWCKQSPAWQVAQILDSNWYNPTPQSINNFVNLKPDVTTIEWENIPIELLRKLEEKWITIKPNIELINVISNKKTEKQLLQNIWQQTAHFVFLNSIKDVKVAFDDLWKWIIKNPIWYDWKWQVYINCIEDIEKLENSDIWENFIYEKLVDYKTEISVIIWRRSNWEIAVFEPIENKHQNWILIESISPARIDYTIKNKAKKIAIKIAEILWIEWLLTVEMFVLSNWDILVNELAPRPHNSWHSTIEWYNQSQYRVLIKAILDEPFWNLELHNSTRMVNLLWNNISSIPWNQPINHHQIQKKWNISYYNYWKWEIKNWRKMWHITTIH